MGHGQGFEVRSVGVCRYEQRSNQASRYGSGDALSCAAAGEFVGSQAKPRFDTRRNAQESEISPMLTGPRSEGFATKVAIVQLLF